MRRTLSITAAGILLAGCVTVSNRTAQDFANELPAEWTSPSTSTGQTPAFWWHNFRDDQLSEAIGQALADNPDVWSAAARLEAAWAQAKIAGADQLPQIIISSGLSKRQENMAAMPFDLPFDIPNKSIRERHNLTLGAQWEMDLWGRVRDSKHAAQANALGQAAEFAGMRHSLAGQVAKAWMIVIESRQQVRLAEFTVTTYETTVERIRARFDQGVRSSLDLRLSEASLAAARSNVAERISVANQATRQLEILLGEIPSNQKAVPHELPSMLPAIPAGIPAELLSRRPDLVAAAHRLQAAGANVRKAKASLYPQISLTASTGTSSSELSELISGDSLIWTIGSNLAQPVFQGGRLRQNVKIQQAHLKLAESTFRSAVLAALSEVENALDSETHLAVMDTSLGEAKKQSEAAAQIAQERYDRGLENIITLLEARRRAINAESRWWLVRRRRLDNRINLHLALGGGFELMNDHGTER